MRSAQIIAESPEWGNLPGSRYAIVELLAVNKHIHLTTSASEGHLLFFFFLFLNADGGDCLLVGSGPGQAPASCGGAD